jgi:hypothetical protein
MAFREVLVCSCSEEQNSSAQFRKAGMNTAFWENDIVITGGQTTSIKMSAPEQGCVEQ